MSHVPADLLYTDHDEWLRVEGTKVTIGITDYAQDQLGELVHAELPEVGATFEAGDVVCEVESVKAVAEIYTPVGGEVVAINEALEDAAETINDDAYAAWLFTLEIDDASALEGLMNAEAYTKKIAD